LIYLSAQEFKARRAIKAILEPLARKALKVFKALKASQD
jgi:hypothetical protein